MKPAGRRYGFRHATDLVAREVRAASEKRGFAQARLLTHWDDIAGPDIAAISRPVSISYGRGGLGATLVLLTTGAHAPVLKMQTPQIRDRVNACYGYNAIGQVKITQTAPTGFAEGQVAFRPKPPERPAPDPAIQTRARQQTAQVENPDLRAALERLGANIISRRNA